MDRFDHPPKEGLWTEVKAVARSGILHPPTRNLIQLREAQGGNLHAPIQTTLFESECALCFRDRIDARGAAAENSCRAAWHNPQKRLKSNEFGAILTKTAKAKIAPEASCSEGIV